VQLNGITAEGVGPSQGLAVVKELLATKAIHRTHGKTSKRINHGLHGSHG
jgi:hypothetical protein